MKIQWSLIAGLVFALLTAIFAVINVEPVSVNFMFSKVDIPLILLILGCTLIGGIIVGSYGIFRQFKLQKEIKLLTSQLTHIQNETGYTAPIPEEPSSTLAKEKDQLPN
ncbi:lipopolysaccharide assembly protein LapA domain-containing protein [Paenibacillus sp. KQZ6P-2]|uniref:Lipopolysaccharide assembly protein LapA domain-containing protein n=1 Tax=Paenibacillus mangrovi TaxID=2931978 RepID=A0A9X1WKE5_9BACL|nr:lipopolysaccharide assembly protein LapA domain-containing protein [Paenibacillus mangrovi]MCJ8010356.1 lipopolysaccharide assembly protein LapA domain-containing protein [Paenibacillus mangrovi]